MSYTCDRCGQVMEAFGASYRLSLDFMQSEPNHPPEANSEYGHLCLECRDKFREFIAYE